MSADAQQPTPFTVEAELRVADPPCGHVGFRTRLAVERGELTDEQAIALLRQLQTGIESLRELARYLYDDVAKEVGVRMQLSGVAGALESAGEHTQRAVDFGTENGVQL